MSPASADVEPTSAVLALRRRRPSGTSHPVAEAQNGRSSADRGDVDLEPANLLDMEPSGLEQVVGQEIDTVSFVRDYVELRIDYSILRALTPPTGVIDGIEWKFGDPGSVDTMLRYIGRRVAAVEIIETKQLVLRLDHDDAFQVSLRAEDRVGAEAAHFVPARPDGSLDPAAMWIW